MKKIITVFVAVAAFAAVGTISSCTKTCDAGFEGKDCKTEMRTKFLGNWTASDSCVVNPLTGSPVLYTVVNNTTGLSSAEEFNITNVAAAGVTVKAKISNTSSFTIPAQDVNYGGATVSVSGDGSITNSDMTVNLTYVISAGSTVTCEAVLTK